MADVQEAIRRLRIEASETGLVTVTGRLNEAAKAQDALGDSSEITGQKFGELERRFASITSAQNDFNRANSVSAQGLAIFAAGITAIVGAAILAVDMIAKFNRQLAEMGSSARRAGMDIEQFQIRQFAAALEGIKGGDFSSGVEKMAMRLNDASRNVNDLSKLLDANNVKFKQGTSLLVDTNRLFEIARDLISRAASEQDKIKIAEMLGLTKEWVPALDKSREEFESIGKEARGLGLIINSDVIQRASDFDREWRKSSEIFSVWMKAKIAEVVPDLDDLIMKAMTFGDRLAEVAKNALNVQPYVFPGGLTETVINNLSDAWKMLNDQNQTFPDNAERVRAALQVLFGIIPDGTAFIIDQTTAFKDYSKIILDAASAAEKWNAAAANMPKPEMPTSFGATTTVPPDEKKNAFDQEIKRLERHIALLKGDAEAMGLGAAAREAFRAQQVLEEAASRDAIGLTEARIKKINEETQAVREAAEAKARARLQADIDFQKQSLFLGPQDRQIAQQLRDLYGNDIPRALNSAEAAQLRFLATIKDIQQSAAQFATTLVQGLAQGHSLMQSLSQSATQLGNALISGGFANIAQGNFLTGGAMVGGGILATLFGGQSQRQQQQRQQAQQQFNDILDLQMRRATAGIDTATLQGALTQFDANAIRERVRAIQAGSRNMAEIEQTLATERQAIIDDFAKKAAATEKAAQEAALKRQTDFVDRQFTAQTDVTTLPGALLAFDRQANKQRLAEQQAGGEAITELEAALSAERLQIIQDFAAKDEALRKAAAQRAMGFQDQLFIALQDQNTLQGKLAVFDIQAQRDREKEQEAGGQALVDLEQLQAVERFQIIEEFNRQAVDAERRTAEDRMNAINSAAKNIIDYLNNLRSGPTSTLSPAQVLANAQAAYNANLILAQQGNIEAQNKFTSLADNLEKAARAFYGSSAGYQAILNQIIEQGLNLPVVQETTDPVVVAIRDSIIELQAIKGHTADTVFNTDPIPLIQPIEQSIHDALVGAVKASIDAGNASAIAAALDSYFTTLDTNVNGLLDFGEFQNGLHGMASDTQLAQMFKTLDTDNSGSLSRLELIHAATGGVVTNTDPISTIASLQGTANSLQTSANAIAIAQQSLLDSINNLTSSELNNTNDITANISAQLPVQRAIAFNTRGANVYDAIPPALTYSQNIWGVLTAARGGWIRGGGVGYDSVPSMLMPGEYVTNSQSARWNGALLDRINRSSGPIANDNWESVDELRALRAEVAALRGDLMRATIAGAQHVREPLDEILGEMVEQTRERKLASQVA